MVVAVILTIACKERKWI